jgi:hypothetical protein
VDLNLFLLVVRRFEAGSIHLFSTVKFCPSPDIAVHLLFKSSSVSPTPHNHCQDITEHTDSMRLIIREDPTSASSYIAHYIISKFLYPAPTFKSNILKTESKPSHQLQPTPLSSVFLPAPLPSKFTKFSSRNTRLAESPSKMSLPSTWYVLASHDPESQLSKSYVVNSITGRIHRHPPRAPRVLPYVHVQALLLPRQRPPKEHPHPEWQCPRPRSRMCRI